MQRLTKRPGTFLAGHSQVGWTRENCHCKPDWAQELGTPWAQRCQDYRIFSHSSWKLLSCRTHELQRFVFTGYCLTLFVSSKREIEHAEKFPIQTTPTNQDTQGTSYFYPGSKSSEHRVVQLTKSQPCCQYRLHKIECLPHYSQFKVYVAPLPDSSLLENRVSKGRFSPKCQ